MRQFPEGKAFRGREVRWRRNKRPSKWSHALQSRQWASGIDTNGKRKWFLLTVGPKFFHWEKPHQVKRRAESLGHGADPTRNTGTAAVFRHSSLKTPWPDATYSAQGWLQPAGQQMVPRCGCQGCWGNRDEPHRWKVIIWRSARSLGWSWRRATGK